MVSVLVTGGAGYLGSVLVPRLLERDYRVRVLDKLIFGRSGLDAVADRMELVAGDIRDIDPSVLDGIDAVVHLAGLSNDPTAEYNPAANASINTEGTIELAKRCKDRGIRRFVFASSCSVYYTIQPDDAIRDEDYDISPEAPYSKSKYLAEIGLRKLADDGFCPVILRKGTIFGPSPRMRYDLVVNTFTKDAFSRRQLTIHAGGRMWRPMLHIEDAVSAYIAALDAPDEKVRGQVFNVVSDNYQVLKIAYEVRRTLESQKGIHLQLEVQQVGTSRSYRVAGDRFESVFELSLSRGIGPAVSEMWDALEEGVDPDAPEYYNIRWLELLMEMRGRLKEMGGNPL